MRAAAPLALVASLALLLPLGTTPALGISTLGSIPVGDSPVSIELRTDGQVAFVANQDETTVSAINLSTQVVTSIDSDYFPSDLRMRPGTNEL
ncbi:MAG: hypothetical protein Q7J04_05915, partial [Microcella sp.]|nr:hypothetical protein [Microcella sp.]